MAYSEILTDVVEGNILKITLNLPERRNPLTPTMTGELTQAFNEAREDSKIRAIILTGTGKTFCAGGDLTALGKVDKGAKMPTLVDLFPAMARSGKPVIAMINGPALAGGFGLALACEIIVAADTALFSTPEIQVGLWPMMIMTQLFRNLPRKKAMELILTGDKIDAQEGARLGFVNKIAPPEKLEEETLALARKLAAKAPATMRLGLRAFYETQDMELEPALRHLEAQLLAVLATPDAREGLTAFMEKRAPRWS